MRAFVAVELPDEARAALQNLQQTLAESQADVAWVKPQNLHVTMRFLGEIADGQRRDIETLLSRIAAGTTPFQTSFSMLGAFPSVSAPRVIWVGIEEGKEHLEKIAKELEGGLRSLKIPSEDRAFVAHVTLGRVRSSKNRRELVERMRSVAWKAPDPFVSDHLTLFQSTLTPAGSIYTLINKAAFSSEFGVRSSE